VPKATLGRAKGLSSREREFPLREQPHRNKQIQAPLETVYTHHDDGTEDLKNGDKIGKIGDDYVYSGAARLKDSKVLI
jgi:hypothetical protein